MLIFIVYLLIFTFLFGAAIGSFINASCYRVHENLNIKTGRSMCPLCKHKLSFFDLIPIFSFIFLKGKCRYCKEKISYQYIIIEVLTGVIFVLYFYFFGIVQILYPTPLNIIQLVFYIFVIISFLYIALYDFLYLEISNKLMVAVSLVTIIYLLVLYFMGFTSISYIFMHIYTAIIVGAVFLLLIVITRGSGMGGGDMKLAFVMGLILGFPSILFVLFLAFLLGALIGIGLIISKVKSMKSTIPFAPFLAYSIIFYIIFNQYILHFLSYFYLL
ncbi:MAG: prepilin peptidase [Patescibacteria group bacterium]